MRRVFVGLSGGVDSGTSAALLKERGYDVIGVFIKIWQPEFIECTWREDRLDAMRVAAHLNILFREIDLSEEYKRDVVDDLVCNYEHGITPNPDVLCNEKIKFGAFYQWAMQNGADFVATGHYARSNEGKLLRGIDNEKDQSYFLYRLSGEQLHHVLFPIGEMTKQDVRARAEKFGLPVANKPDSQGLCFVGDVSMSNFLRRYIKVEKGNVFDKNGSIIGEHEGAALYTIGQRHGFAITQPTSQTSPAMPHYVLSVDTNANTVTVSTNKKDVMRMKINLRDIHWITEQGNSADVVAQVRYRAQPAAARLRGNHCEFEAPELCSPGQSMVFYRGEECLGGAIIAL